MDGEFIRVFTIKGRVEEKKSKNERERKENGNRYEVGMIQRKDTWRMGKVVIMIS